MTLLYETSMCENIIIWTAQKETIILVFGKYYIAFSCLLGNSMLYSHAGVQVSLGPQYLTPALSVCEGPQDIEYNSCIFPDSAGIAFLHYFWDLNT